MKFNQKLLAMLLIGGTLVPNAVVATTVNPSAVPMPNVSVTTNEVTTSANAAASADKIASKEMSKEEFDTFYRNKMEEDIKKYYDSNYKGSKEVIVTNYGDEAVVQKEIEDRYLATYKGCIEKEGMSEEEATKVAKEAQEVTKKVIQEMKELLGHDYATVGVLNDNCEYYAMYNTETKEVIKMSFCEYATLKNATDRNYEENPLIETEMKEVETIAIEFINKHSVGGIQTPQMVKAAPDVDGIYMLYQEATDDSKKLVVAVDPNSKKVIEFCTGNYIESYMEDYFK